MKKLTLIYILCLFVMPAFGVTYGTMYKGGVQSSRNIELSQVYVPLTNNTVNSVNYHVYNSYAINNTNASGNKVFTRVTSTSAKLNSYSGGSVSYAAGPGDRGQGDQGGQGGQGSGGWNPGGGGSTTKTYEHTCPMCNGTGYINDNGDGEVVTATWWRATGAGDGTYCDGVTTYHDPCDEDLYGQTYHHDGKRVCPQCKGTGTVTTNSRNTPSVISGWVQWTGTSWSHLWHDEDGDGHCDDHWWHEPIGDIPTYLILPTIILYSKLRRKRKETNYEKN